LNSHYLVLSELAFIKNINYLEPSKRKLIFDDLFANCVKKTSFFILFLQMLLTKIFAHRSILFENDSVFK
jgi:hypothetical protein